jgi:hypothetical protein
MTWTRAEVDAWILNHYDHAESVVTGHRVFRDLRGQQEIEFSIHQFAGRAGVSDEEIELLLQANGYRLDRT